MLAVCRNKSLLKWFWRCFSRGIQKPKGQVTQSALESKTTTLSVNEAINSTYLLHVSPALSVCRACIITSSHCTPTEWLWHSLHQHERIRHKCRPFSQCTTVQQTKMESVTTHLLDIIARTLCILCNYGRYSDVWIPGPALKSELLESYSHGSDL